MMLIFLFLHALSFREKPKLVKPAADSNDGPDAKKAKVDPNETTMVKKVGAKTSHRYFYFIPPADHFYL